MPVSIDPNIEHYRVSWVIDIDAATPEQAARKARKIQRRNSIATVFVVEDDNYDRTTVDLTALDGKDGDL